MIKVTGIERTEQRGPARVFDCEEAAMAAVTGRTNPLRRYHGDSLRRPARWSGNARDAGRHQRHRGRRFVGKCCADHRRTLQRRHARILVGHVAPEAAVGGPIAAVEEGDTIRLDISKRIIDLEIPTATLEARLQKWKAPEPRYRSGVFAKYVALVGSASEGAPTAPGL